MAEYIDLSAGQRKLLIPAFLRPSNCPVLHIDVHAVRGAAMRMQILRFLADGLSQGEIAKRCNISIRLVKYHIEVLRDISGAVTSWGLVGWAFRERILEVGGDFEGTRSLNSRRQQ